jgi:hypothetical protein
MKVTAMPDEDLALFQGWLQAKQQKTERKRSLDPYVHHGLRFVFYGRVSTSGYQDPLASRSWQVEIAERLVDGHGVIVDSVFDVGCSRTRAWHQRPAAARLLASLADPERGFDAIVVGEYERAFSGRQFEDLMPLLEEHGVQFWLPEAGGRVDFDSVEHRYLMMVLGAQSEREVIRTRNRVIQAMRVPPIARRLSRHGPIGPEGSRPWHHRRSTPTS